MRYAYSISSIPALVHASSIYRGSHAAVGRMFTTGSHAAVGRVFTTGSCAAVGRMFITGSRAVVGRMLIYSCCVECLYLRP